MAMYVKTRRWTRREYERLIDLGVFQPDERLELIGGELTVREPQGGPHSLAMELSGDGARLLRRGGDGSRSDRAHPIPPGPEVVPGAQAGAPGPAWLALQ